MPQNGFHGLVGLAAARATARRVPSAFIAPFVFGVVLGAMLPDIDGYPTAVAVLAAGHDMVYLVHRTASHSLLALVTLAIAGVFSNGKMRWTFWGLTLGASTHLLLDTFFWFAQIDLFWPLSRLPKDHPLLPIINLWWGVELPGLAINIREACEYLAFGLFFHALRNIAPESGRYLRKWEIFCWVWLPVSLGTAFLFAEKPSMQNYVVSTPYLLAIFPVAMVATWKLHHEIAAWAVNAKV